MLLVLTSPAGCRQVVQNRDVEHLALARKPLLLPMTPHSPASNKAIKVTVKGCSRMVAEIAILQEILGHR
jgi:hypothetical protein